MTFESLKCDRPIKMKAVRQYVPKVLSITMQSGSNFISVNEILTCDHSCESY